MDYEEAWYTVMRQLERDCELGHAHKSKRPLLLMQEFEKKIGADRSELDKTIELVSKYRDEIVERGQRTSWILLGDLIEWLQNSPLRAAVKPERFDKHEPCSDDANCSGCHRFSRYCPKCVDGSG